MAFIPAFSPSNDTLRDVTVAELGRLIVALAYEIKLFSVRNTLLDKL